MTQQERHILDSLNDIKKIMYYSFDTIDYSVYITELNSLIEQLSEMLNVSDNKEDYDRIFALKKSVEFYLKKAEELQNIYLRSLEDQEEKGQ